MENLTQIPCATEAASVTNFYLTRMILNVSEFSRLIGEILNVMHGVLLGPNAGNLGELPQLLKWCVASEKA